MAGTSDSGEAGSLRLSTMTAIDRDDASAAAADALSYMLALANRHAQVDESIDAAAILLEPTTGIPEFDLPAAGGLEPLRDFEDISRFTGFTYGFGSTPVIASDKASELSEVQLRFEAQRHALIGNTPDASVTAGVTVLAQGQLEYATRGLGSAGVMGECGEFLT